MASNLCKCGNPSHPLYGERCEDCYASSMDHCFPKRPESGVVKDRLNLSPPKVMVESMHLRGGEYK